MHPVEFDLARGSYCAAMAIGNAGAVATTVMTRRRGHELVAVLLDAGESQLHAWTSRATAVETVNHTRCARRRIACAARTTPTATLEGLGA